jgi:succinoglycan biosynthesis protein ExoM
VTVPGGFPGREGPPLRPVPPPAPQPAATPRVAVCVATFQRPVGVRRLLECLAAQALAPGQADVFVVVVDNDAEATARAAVQGARLPFPLVYEVEPERNISLARNRGVAAALARGAEWIAFVDDDEVVDEDWLSQLLRARLRHGADIVVGAMEAAYPPGMPAWLAQGVFYGAVPNLDGTPLSVANTGNVLVAAPLLAGAPGPFDPAFGRTGGSDSHLFMRLHREGARIVFASRAVAQEMIPESRARAGWVLRRAFRVGNTAMLAERALPTGRPAMRLGKALLRLGYGVVMLPLGVLGRAWLMRSMWNVAYGCGAVAGLFGIRYQEYKRLHGD